ncbi:SIMPL domain-containing protein [Chloroflexota bacterium]
MKKRYLLVTGLLLVVLSLGITGCDGTLPSGTVPQVSGGNIILSQQNTGIWVNGQGVISVIPDVAILSVGVETQEKTVAKAQRQAAEAMEAIIGVLDQNGVAEKDIRTSRFSIRQIRDTINNRQIIIGYRVTNMVTAKIRNVDDTGAIIDAVAEAGGDFTRIDNVGFTVDDPTAYHEEVRKIAMADAEVKAEQLADLADVSLGAPTYISEGSISAPVSRDIFFEGGILAPAPLPTTSISPGESEIRLNVQVVYSLK